MYNFNGLSSKNEEIRKIIFHNCRLRKTDEQSLTTENDAPKITLDALEKQSRKFNIDLTPKVSTDGNNIFFS